MKCVSGNFLETVDIYLTGFGKRYPQKFGLFSLFWRVSASTLQSRRYKNIRYTSHFSFSSLFLLPFASLLGDVSAF